MPKKEQPGGCSFSVTCVEVVEVGADAGGLEGAAAQAAAEKPLVAGARLVAASVCYRKGGPIRGVTPGDGMMVEILMIGSKLLSL